MKVHFIANTAFPYGAATTTRTLSYAKGFIDNGVECEVIIPIPTCSASDKMNIEHKGIYKGVPFRYSYPSTRRSASFIKRRYHDFVGQVKTLYHILRIPKGDIVLLYNGNNSWNRLALLACKLSGIKSVLEMNELPYCEGEQTKDRQKQRQITLEKILPKFNGVIVISDELGKLVRKYSNAKIIKVPIITPPDTNHQADCNNNERFIFHSGKLTEAKDGVCGMLEAFGIAFPKIGKDVKFILTGNVEMSPDKDKIKAIISKYSLEENVVFTGYIEEEELRKYQSNCTMVIINKYDSLQNKYCFATKLSEYLAMKRPVVTTNIGEAMNYLQDNVNAYIVEPHNPQLIADKIIEIFNNPQKAAEIGENGFLLTTKEFNYKYQGKRMLEFFKTL